MTDALTKFTKQAEDSGAKASQETFNGLTLHILRDAADDKPKAKDQEKGDDKSPDFSLAWTQSESSFYFSVATPGGDVEVIKDLTAHREGRDNSLASNESFSKTQAKLDSGQAQSRLVPRRRQGDQAGPQGQRPRQRGTDAAE